MFECQHLESCSKPERYWTRSSEVILVDGNGDEVEIIPDPPDDKSFCCCECEEPAEFVKVKPIKPSKKKVAVAPQGVLI